MPTPELVLLTSLKSFIHHQSTVIKNVVTILIIFGVEAIVISEKLFECPGEGYAPYGWMFIIAPGMILFMFALALNEDFLNLVRGCCHSEERAEKSCPCSKRPNCCDCKTLKKLVKVVFYSTPVCYLWVFWAFFQREYYTCAILGNKEVRLANKTEEAQEKIKQEYTESDNYSQFISFIILSVFVGVYLIVVTGYYCCCKPKSSIPRIEKYKEMEAKSAEKAYKEKIKTLAKNKGEEKASACFTIAIDNESMAVKDIIEKAQGNLFKKYPHHLEGKPRKDDHPTAAENQSIEMNEIKMTEGPPESGSRENKC